MERVDSFLPPLQPYHHNNFTSPYDLMKLDNGNGRLTEFVGILIVLITLVALVDLKVLENHKSNRRFLQNIKSFILGTLYCLSCMSLPLIITIMAIFMLVKQIVSMILMLKYKNSFGGILDSADAVWAIEDVSKSVINIVIQIDLKNSQNLTQQMKTKIFEIVFRHPESFPKLTSIRRREMGFNFLIKNQVTIEDCISTFNFKIKNEYLSEATLFEVVSKYSNRPLPKQNSALWEIIISSIPMKQNEKDASVFPVMLRFTHIVGDGLALTNFFLRSLSNNFHELNIDFERATRSNKINSNNKNASCYWIKLKSLLTTISNNIDSILMAPAIILYETYLRKEDSNALHNCRLSGDKILVSAMEGEKRLLPLVKKIKNSMPSATFSDVVLTGISGSLNKYFENTSSFAPNFATAVLTRLLSPPNMNERPILQNQFSVALLDLPVLVKSNSMVDRLGAVMEHTYKLRKSHDWQVNYWLLNWFSGVIPHPVLRAVMNSNKATMSISSVPGPQKLSILDGCDIENIFFYTPHRGTTGVGFSILTYDDRFQIGLIVDKAIISSTDKAQLIVDGIFKHINLLAEELLSTCAPPQNDDSNMNLVVTSEFRLKQQRVSSSHGRHTEFQDVPFKIYITMEKQKTNRIFLYYTRGFILGIFYCLSCMSLPLIIIIMAIFMVLKQIVEMILMLKYKDTFGGILDSADAIWAVEDVSKTVINIVFQINVNTSQNLAQQIKTKFFEKVFQHPESFPKLTSIRRREMGFNFLMKNQVTIEDCISSFDFNIKNEYLSETTLNEVISEYSNRPLPKQNSALWEIIVSPIPMDMKQNEKEARSFPVMLRCSHIVGDGLAITNFLLRTLSNNCHELNINIFQNAVRSNKPISNNGTFFCYRIKLKSLLKSISNNIVSIFMAPAVILYETHLRKYDSNALHNSQLSGDKILVSAVEREKQVIPLVKKIKNAIGATFSEVVLTAVSGSLSEYFEHTSNIAPNFATTVLTILMSLPSLDEKPVLQNQFSVALLDLPVLVESNSMIERLQTVIDQMDKLRKSPETQINYWVFKWFSGIIPHPVLRLLNMSAATMSFSSVPGPQKVSILEGYGVENVIFYTPHRGTTGVGFSILTYDDRFQIGLTVDKAIISSTHKAQLIVDGIFKHINLLAEELSITH